MSRLNALLRAVVAPLRAFDQRIARRSLANARDELGRRAARIASERAVATLEPEGGAPAAAIV